MARHGYSELFRTIQEAFAPEDMSEERITSWLYHGERGKHSVKAGFDKKGKQRYKDVNGKPVSNATIRLARTLSETSKVSKRIDEVEVSDYKAVTGLQDDIRGLVVHESTLTSKLAPKLKLAEQINTDIEEIKKEVESIKSLPVDEQKRLYKEGTEKQRELAGVAIGETSPQRLGGLVRGSQQQGLKALRKVFG